ncbi:cytoplasmic protein [Marmoricola sp. Leaf446]|uniref:MSMEG_6728 family protein n=1 Tax=Marmoricola sp. Leaf446 TaxID=1736379 RepID=UPI0006F6501F|nr:MSMEG_6728 family protein [Marmoricola sp. Leaf446]KQT91022.1 cytoplasmic protein [Marmoricola sp. Leaf446]
MQTFLPYADPEASARALDAKRLGKQRVECLQVVRGLTVPGYGWRRHPAVTMWTGCLEALGRYSLTCCEVWVEAGRADTVAETLRAELAAGGVARVRTQAELEGAGEVPWWWGHESVHRSHRSALLRKDPEHYGPMFPDVAADLAYVWPGPEPREITEGEASARFVPSPPRGGRQG